MEFVVKLTLPVGFTTVPSVELSLIVTAHWTVPFTRAVAGAQDIDV